jgi:DNA-binding transcriptional LysR family regulator
VELRHLRYFVAVAEALHFSRAAQRLHVAQPALSQQIQKLERELGVTLLARTKRRVSLTEPGKAFLEEARRTLSNAESAITAARRAAAGETGRLRVGYVEWGIYLFLPAVLRRYRELYPAVDLRIAVMDREPQREALLRGDLDLGFFALRDDERGFSAELMAADPLVSVLPDTHPGARRRRVPLAALGADPWVLLPRELRTQYVEVVLRACAAAGFAPHVVQEAPELGSVAALVSAGLGVSLVPRAFASRPRDHVAVRPLTGPAPVLPHHAVWRTDALAPAAARFLAVAQDVRDARDERPTPPSAP